MPELPEIEGLVRDLRPILAGRAIAGVECRQPKALNLPLEEMRRLVHGPVGRVWRRAKSAVMDLPEGTLWVHLGLGGRVIHSVEPVPEATFAFLLDDGSWLAMHHTFMGHAHYVSPADLPAVLARLGPEPLEMEPADTEAVLTRGRSQILKALLMDQARIAGIGNVYSDEILHRLKVYPGCRARDLPADRRARMHAVMREVLGEAVEAGGEPGFESVGGRAGVYRMRVHRQETCGVCGAAVEKLSLAGRAAYRCPHCQPE